MNQTGEVVFPRTARDLDDIEEGSTVAFIFGRSRRISLSELNKTLRNLKHVRISSNRVPRLRELYLTIASLPSSLETLDLSCKFYSFPEMFEHFHSLRHLRLCTHPSEFSGLSTMFEKMTSLEFLDLGATKFGRIKVHESAISHLVHLKSLSLANNDLFPKHIAILASSFKRLRSLKSLNLSMNSLTHASVNLVLEALLESHGCLENLNLRYNQLGDPKDLGDDLIVYSQRLSKLKSLNVSNTQLSDRLADMLICSEHVQELELEEVRFTAETISSIFPVLLQLPGLIRLNLNKNIIGTSGAKALAPVLERLTTLQALELGQNGFDTEGAKALAPALGKLVSLRTLDLRRNQFGSRGVELLLSAIEHLQSLVDLNLEGNEIDSPTALALARVLGRNSSTLKTLHLGETFLGNEEAKTIAPELAKLSSLQNLIFFRNRIHVEGLTELSKAFQEGLFISSLRILSLGSCNFGVAGAKALAPGLERLVLLEELSLGSNQIMEEGGKAIASVLPKLRNLVSLNFAYNQLRAEGTLAVVQSLSTLDLLDTLHLQVNEVEPDKTGILAPYLGRMKNLQWLDFYANSLVGGGMKAWAIHLLEPRPHLLVRDAELLVFTKYQEAFDLLTLISSLRGHSLLTPMRMLPMELSSELVVTST